MAIRKNGSWIPARRTAKWSGNRRAADTVASRLMSELITARKTFGFSQSEVARRMKVPQSAIVRLEAGTHSPTLNTLSRFAAAIGVKFEVRKHA